jgi:hypothetical protein
MQDRDAVDAVAAERRRLPVVEFSAGQHDAEGYE